MRNRLPLPKTKRNFFLTLLLFLIALFLFVVFILAIRNTNQKVFEVEAALQDEIRRDEEIRSLKTLLTNTEAEQEELNRHIVKDGEEAQFLEFVERVAQEAGVELDISSVETAEKKNDPYFEYLELTLQAKGSWSRVSRFGALIEHMPYIHLLKSGRLETQPVGEGGFEWVSTLTLRVGKDKEK